MQNDVGRFYSILVLRFHCCRLYIYNSDIEMTNITVTHNRHSRLSFWVTPPNTNRAGRKSHFSKNIQDGGLNWDGKLFGVCVDQRTMIHTWHETANVNRNQRTRWLWRMDILSFPTFIKSLPIIIAGRGYWGTPLHQSSHCVLPHLFFIFTARISIYSNPDHAVFSLFYPYTFHILTIVY